VAERPITDPAEGSLRLRRLAGRWQGTGSGRFPTIEPFEYRESFCANVRRDGEGTVHYEQQTWRSGGPDDGEALHWESGFLMARDDGRVELLNAQESRRVEVLVGDLFVDDARPAACVLRLRSVVQAHDERMVATTREVRFDDAALAYEVGMATTRVPALEPHLSGALTRIGRSDAPDRG